MNIASSNRDIRFVCTACGARVLPISYRASCPDCGGTLRSAPPGLDDS